MTHDERPFIAAVRRWVREHNRETRSLGLRDFYDLDERPATIQTPNGVWIALWKYQDSRDLPAREATDASD